MPQTSSNAPLAEPRAGETASAPWHFWVLAPAGLLWNAFGAVDYTMTKLRVADWLAKVDPAILAKVEAAPAWATAAWAAGVWGSFLGALLLLLKSRHAVPAFMVSLVGAVVSFTWQFQVGIVSTPVLPAVIIAVVVFFWRYAAAMRRAGVLR